MPAGAVYVGRPTKWGNIARVGDDTTINGRPATVTPAMAVDIFRFWLDGETIADARAELRGRDLVCWCPLDQPCHADVLLEIANREETQ